MCKSIKDGGSRCAYHLCESANAALVTYVATTTGLGGAATRTAVADLTAEFADAPDPTRAQVDDFLEQQAFRVRHEPGLTEKRRESIIRRLQAAIGHVTPSGAVFKAWKNLVAEAWTRVRRTATAAFVVGAITFSLGACGTTGNDQPVDPIRAEHVASANVDPTAAASPTAEASPWKVKDVQIQQRAVDLYGQDMAEKGADMAETLARDYGFNENSVKYPSGEGVAASRKWMLEARKDMTPSAAADWTKTVDSYFAGKEFSSENPAWGNIMSYTSYGLYSKGMYPAEGTPISENPTIKSLEVDVAADGRLWVTMKSSITYNFVNEGEAMQSVATREQELWLTRSGDQWKIDGWKGNVDLKVVQ